VFEDLESRRLLSGNPAVTWIVTKGFGTTAGDSYGRALYGLCDDGHGGLVEVYKPTGLPAGDFFFASRINGNKVVFHAGNDPIHPERGNIYLGTLSSDTITHVTNFGYRDIPAGSIVWTADGSGILFSNIWSGISKMDLDPNTNDETLLTTDYCDEVESTRSAEPSIFFWNAHGTSRALTMTSTGGSRAGHDPFGDGSTDAAVVSPDGTKVALLRGGHNGVWLADANTWSLITPVSSPLTADPVNYIGACDGWMAWSPDSKSIAYVSGGQLWSINADGTNYHQVSTGTFGDLRVWSAVVTTPPTAVLSLGSIVVGASSATFSVTYTDDDDAVVVSTIDGSDVRVTASNGFDQFATLVGVTPGTDGSPITATYQITAPNGTWGTSDLGTYTATMQDNQVRNTHNEFVAGGVLAIYTPSQNVTPPANVSASDDAFTDKVRVTWSTAAGATAYEVWRNTSNNPLTSKRISGTDVTGLSYDDKTALAGTQYWYWVIAKNTLSTSDFSAPDQGRRAQGTATIATTSSVTSSANPSYYGQSVMFKVKVSAVAPSTATPTGSVTFKCGSKILGTQPLNARGIATITVSSLDAGSRIVKAFYLGTGDFSPSTGSLTQTVKKVNSSSKITASPNPSVVGKVVTFTVTVTTGGHGTATGNVVFKDNGTQVATAAVRNGKAVFQTSRLKVGTHTITATYSGNGNFNGSKTSLTQTVKKVALMVDADTAPRGSVELLTDRQVALMLVEAERRWAAAKGIQTLAAMAGVEIQLANLPSGMLGEVVGKTILIDRDAAGYGWFVDTTPGRDEEYVHAEREEYSGLWAVDPRAVDRVDLLTVVEHELGHVLGLSDMDRAADELMSGWLRPGVRREPSGC
jgi:hypothetical protein